MKITMYELLGLVKDGKAPRKIKYKDFIYEYYEQENVIDYRCYDEKSELYGYLSSCVDYETFNILDNEVEILEEEKEIPEKLEIYKENDDEDYFANILKVSKNGECEIDEATSVIVDKVNEIIDYLEYFKSKGDA